MWTFYIWIEYILCINQNSKFKIYYSSQKRSILQTRSILHRTPQQALNLPGMKPAYDESELYAFANEPILEMTINVFTQYLAFRQIVEHLACSGELPIFYIELLYEQGHDVRIEIEAQLYYRGEAQDFSRKPKMKLELDHQCF